MPDPTTSTPSRSAATRDPAPGSPPRSRDGFLDIGEYAAIGDGRTLALVGTNGSIDWMCLPSLDSPPVFGALLSPREGGHFRLEPAIPYTAHRVYIERTNVLQTTFETAEGTVRVTDALTLDSSITAPWRELVRHVEGLSGAVPMRWECDPRFEFGQVTPRWEAHERGVVARHRDLQIAVRTWDADPDDSGRAGRPTVSEGQSCLLVMTGATGPLPLPDREAVQRRLDETLRVWRDWVTRHTYEGPWQDAVERSLLALRLLCDGRRGALAAAGTTSLPEVLGGQRNYDYRFGWVRDASFTLEALMTVGMEEITYSVVGWLLSAVAHTRPRVDPVYALDGTVVRSQHPLPLPGYRLTEPVNVGNQAGSQLQLGGWGDLMETIFHYVRSGHILDPDSALGLADACNLLCRIWGREDAGLWELSQTAHYGTSKLSCWTALRRAVELAESGDLPSTYIEQWRRERDAIRRFIEERLWSPTQSSYLQKAGSDALDCGMLLAARRGFADPRGPEMQGTIAAIQRELSAEGPLLYRYSGMQDSENAFLACSFWLVEALALGDRRDEASELMEQLVAVTNDVGLLSEEMVPDSRQLRGNVPQALSHLSLINAAVALG